MCGKEFIGACQNLKKSFNHSIFFVSNLIYLILAEMFLNINSFYTSQNHLMNVSFTTEERDVVEFNQDGDASAHYDIINYQMKDDNSYDYVQIGEWINHSLNFFKTLQSPPSGKVKSVCSDPCMPGFYKVDM